MKPKIAIVGAGIRGLHTYGSYIKKHPDAADVVAVAEPQERLRKLAAEQFNLPEDALYSSWEEFAKSSKMADAVIIATQDKDHTHPACVLMEQGYHVLLEKPMALNEEECRQIVNCAKSNDVLLAVCHVLRYTNYFQKMKEIVQSGVLGQLTVVRHIEQVGYWHHAHSYVRGNWRNEEVASPMLLAKSCHDLDILLFLLERRCLRVSSFGSLTHFKAENRPEGAADRCTDCSLVDSCAYSAPRFYNKRLEETKGDWPINVIAREASPEGVREALESGPYGRCVYSCDNNVVDHQVVNMEFEGGLHASFVMNSFSEESCRRTEIYGSNGELRGDGEKIKVLNFSSGKEEVFDFSSNGDDVVRHLGGDAGLMSDFISALKTGRKQSITSGPEVSLESHLIVFAAERARHSGSVESVVID